MDSKKAFAAELPAVGAAQVSSDADASDIVSPDPPMMLALSADERLLFAHICLTLRQAGIEHMTAGMPIAIIVRTFADWLAAAEKCRVEGRTQISKTGWATPTPWADDEKRLKMELGQWLPKACLTIPSLARVRKDTGEQGKQDDLFGDLVKHGTALPAPQSRH